MRHLRSACCGAALIILAACSTSAQSAKQMAPSEVVATIGTATITLGEVDAVAMQEPASNFGSARLVQALYLARRSALDELVATRLIDQEAKAQGLGHDAFVEKEINTATPMPTDADIERWYQANPDAAQGRSLDALRAPIRSFLIQQGVTTARDALVEKLKLKTRVTVSLEPPRQSITSAGHPSKGPKDAPVEIVEFSDFQCPFCQRANPTVDQVLKTYGDRIHFVYRHFPLPGHPNARPAAEAAACANAQGRFWEYHDQLFAHPDQLTDADLKNHATAVGLDAGQFKTCVDTHQFKSEVDQDLLEAGDAGVTGTPAFFINGRSLEGAQPYEAFTQLIDEELAAKKK
jgi:protein-disulfide isomerase